MTPTEVIIWTCVFVFVCTAVIAVLSLVKVINISEPFRTRLFYVVVIEIALSSVYVFKNSMSDPMETNFIRIVNPTPTAQLSFIQGQTLYLYGVCLNGDSATFSGEIYANNKVYPMDNFQIDSRNVFAVSTQLNDTFPIARVKMIVRLSKGDKILFIDSTSTNLAVSRR